MARLVPLATIAIAVIVLAFAGPAAAQTSASATVTITELPASLPALLKQSEKGTATFKLQVEAMNFGCAMASSFTVAVTVTSKIAGANATVEPAEVTLPINPGIYAAGPGPASSAIKPYNQSAPATLTVSAPGVVPANVTGKVEIAATLAGGTPEGCNANFPEGSATASLDGGLLAPPKAPPPTPEPAKSPAPAAVLAVLAVAAVALARGGRRAR